MNEQTTDIASSSLEIQPVVAALKQALGRNLAAIVLFGSRARNEAGPGSDWDLLLLAHQLPPKPFQRHLHIKKMLPDAQRGEVAIIAKTPAEFESYLSELYLDIALDGVVLYDTNEYAADHLAYLRTLIQAQGLQRDRQHHDMVWRWQKFPGHSWVLEWGTAV